MRVTALAVAVCLAGLGCKKKEEREGTQGAPSAPNALAAAKPAVVGLVTDIGGRGDQSFNDSALRGLEAWAGNVRFAQGKYVPLTADERAKLLPASLAKDVQPLPVKPLVVQSKAQEDYEPNLQLLVDQGSDLVVGVGFMLENAVEAIAKANPAAKFLLVDSPILDASGKPSALPNVRTVVFREEEGSFLVGALAGLVAKEKVAFVGGMEIPLIKKFEAGFRAGVKTTNPKAEVLIQYTGSFDNVAKGKQAAQDVVAKNAEVVFQAAGSDGLGVIQAVKEARAAGKSCFVIGVDSDQAHLAPDAVLTSMVKQVDLAVWRASKRLLDKQFVGGDEALGLKDGAVAYAPVTVDFPGKAEALAKVEALRAAIVEGKLKVPSNLAELDAFTPP